MDHQICEWGPSLLHLHDISSMPAVPSEVQSLLRTDYCASCMLVPVFLSMWPIFLLM